MERSRLLGRPTSHEYDPYFEAYVSLAPEDDIVAGLAAQGDDTQRMLAHISDADASIPPAPGEWTLKQVVGHLTDSERVFSYRILRFSRGDLTPLAPFDQDQFVAAAGFNDRPLADLLDELAALRRATVYLVASLPPASELIRGVAFQGETSVRAIAWITLGHERKHLNDIKQNFAHLL